MKMDRPDASKGTVKLAKIRFDGMDIPGHEADDINTRPSILTDKIFSGKFKSGWDIYGVVVFVAIAFFLKILSGSFISKKYAEIIENKIGIDFLFEEFRFFTMEVEKSVGMFEVAEGDFDAPRFPLGVRYSKAGIKVLWKEYKL